MLGQSQLKKKLLFAYILIGVTISISFVVLYDFFILRQELVASEVRYASLTGYLNRIPLSISHSMDSKDVYGDGRAHVFIYSNKMLAVEDLDVLDVEFDESLNRFIYKIELKNVNLGENRVKFIFEDLSSNFQEVMLTIPATEEQSPNKDIIPDFEDSVVSPNYDSILALVSKKYRLPANFVPEDIVYLPDYGIPTTGGGHLRVEVAESLKDMINAMQEEGLDLEISSTYRSYDVQIDTYNYWLRYNNWDYNKTDNVSARPGHSEHQLATTIDVVNDEINNKLTQEFSNTKAFMWLRDNAHEYGFVMSYPENKENITGYSYEPWHWRYIGIDEAREFKDSGLTLIEYLKLKFN